MSSYYLSFRNNTCLELLENIDQYCEYLKVITKDYNLQAPTCLYNEHVIIKDFCQKKWLNTYPSFDFVYDKLVKRKMLFSVPIDQLHYLYFHFLNTYNELSKTENFNFIDEDTEIPYSKLSYYLTTFNMEAVDFFTEYLNKDKSSDKFDSFLKLEDKKETTENGTYSNQS